MKDDTTTLQEIRDLLASFVKERDWDQFHSPKNIAMAMAAETGELMEHFLWDESAASHTKVKDPKRLEAVQEELADIIIYAFEFANATGIDISSAIEDKVAKNARKYPVEKAKGNARKYTEF